MVFVYSGEIHHICMRTLEAVEFMKGNFGTVTSVHNHFITQEKHII